MMLRKLFFLCVLSSGFGGSSLIALAAQTTTPYWFTEQTTVGTGQVEWDEFTSSNPSPTDLGPHAPDVIASGVGSASITASDGGFVTSTRNIYSFGAEVLYTLELQGLTATEAETTVVLQLAATGAFDLDSVLLDGSVPSEIVDRGIATAKHGPAQGEFDTHYYWAKWQVPAATNYSLTFGHPADHISFAQARVDYFNSITVFDAAIPGSVPEPGALILGSIGLMSFASVCRRRR